MNSEQTTREKLIAAGQRVIAREGYAAATARAVTKEAGVSLAMIRYHFGTQEDLIKAVVMDAASGMLEAAWAMAQAEDLAGVLDASLRFIQQLPDSREVRVVIEATLHAPTTPWLQAWASEQIGQFRELIAAKAPSHLDDEQRRAIGLVIAALLDGAALHHLILPDTDLAALKEGAALLVRGLDRHPPRDSGAPG